MQRDSVLDICRGIGILAVIAGHIPINAIQVNFIYFFHMPLFFYCSGVTHSKSSFQKSLSASALLLTNYLLYGLAFCFITMLLFGQNIEENLYDLVSATPASVWSIRAFGVYWFILALAVLKFICSAEFLYRNWLWGLLLFFVTALLSNYINFDNIPLSIGPALLGLVFFQAGQYHTGFLGIIRSHSAWMLATTFVLYVGISAYSIAAFGGVERKLINYHHTELFNSFLALLLGFLGVAFTIVVSYILASRKYLLQILGFYGKSSFVLFVTHLLIIEAIYSAVPTDVWQHHPLFSKTITFTVTLVICTIIAHLVNQASGRKSKIRKLLFMQ